MIQPSNIVDVNGQPRTAGFSSVNGPDYDFRSKSWFRDQVEKGRREMFGQIVLLTPELAKILLENNPDNRNLKHYKIKEMTSDIKEGRWKLNGETIIVARDGELNDGQNRCHAVIEANLPVRIWMIFGAERSSRDTVDMGISRTCGDILTLDNQSNSTVSSAAARLLCAYDQGLYSINKNDAISKSRVVEHYYKHQKLIMRAIDKTNGKFFCGTGRSAHVAAYVVLYHINPELVDHFFACLEAGEGLRKGDAALQMRMHFMEIGKKRMRNWEKLELILRYWNAYISKSPCNRNLSIKTEYPDLRG